MDVRYNVPVGISEKIKRCGNGFASRKYLQPLKIVHDPKKSPGFCDFMEHLPYQQIEKVISSTDIGMKHKIWTAQNYSNSSAFVNPHNLMTNNRSFSDIPHTSFRISPNSSLQLKEGSPNGEFNALIGEKVGQRYEIKGLLGKGSFGQVFKALDSHSNTLVAIKIIKSKKAFYEQGKFELHLLQHINERDIYKKYIVLCLNCFTWKNHLCIVFELLYHNLYELLKQGGFKGLPLNIVKTISRQLIEVISFLKLLRIIHCDLKPENILLVDNRSYQVKVADMGSSCYSSNKPYKYIQSRFYRSPEVILELGYDESIDMWSLGCVMVELVTGEALFRGSNEIDQLSCMMEVLGSIPSSMVQSSPKSGNFFNYFSVKDEYILKESLSVKAYRPPGTKSLSTILNKSSVMKIPTNETIFFENLVSSILIYQPNFRMDPDNAMYHIFFDSKNPLDEHCLYSNSNIRYSGTSKNRITKSKFPSCLNSHISTSFPSIPPANYLTHHQNHSNKMTEDISDKSKLLSYPLYSMTSIRDDFSNSHKSNPYIQNTSINANPVELPKYHSYTYESNYPINNSKYYKNLTNNQLNKTNSNSILVSNHYNNPICCSYCSYSDSKCKVPSYNITTEYSNITSPLPHMKYYPSLNFESLKTQNSSHQFENPACFLAPSFQPIYMCQENVQIPRNGKIH